MCCDLETACQNFWRSICRAIYNYVIYPIIYTTWKVTSTITFYILKVVILKTVMLFIFTLVCRFMCAPSEGGNLRSGTSTFEVVDGEFDKVTVKFFRGMSCDVLVNKDFDATGKPTIVFYHGFPDNQYSFVDSMRHFNKLGYNVVAPPLRGYQTLCIPLDGDMSIAASAQDVRSVLEQLNLTQAEANVHLVGHDWGSMVVQAASKLNPFLFRSVTLVSIPDA